jgi:uncharacterized repeat protein (TIGR01451 family)
MMRISTLFLGAALAVSLPASVYAQAQQAVAISSKVQVVREVKDAKGIVKRILAEPTKVVPGDPLVFWITYKNNGARPATSFVVNNPLPKAVAFTALGENSGWGVVSIDGGQTFGPLATMKVTRQDKSSRPATPADVTNVRWLFAKPIPPGTGGTLSFYGVIK